tara:strand:- start:338 stop:835 length:498 start_codon:yes stop_codon:yes gene_type:complete
MKLKQISQWISYEAMNVQLKNKIIKSWLLEEGPITKRIESNEKFELKLLRDDLGNVSKLDRLFLGHLSGDIKIREVILYGDKNPRVYAQSIIPVETINQGLSKLGELGTKPLGDILFEKNIFKKEDTIFAQFKDDKNIFWGRKTKYNVKNKPFSVMEVFLIDQDE